FLEVPQRIVDLSPPRGDVDITTNTELFEHHTQPAFDPLDAARSSADITLLALLDPRRAARLDRFHAENPANPDFNDVVTSIIGIVVKPQTGVPSSINHATARLFATRTMELANNRAADAQVRADA